MPRAQFCKSNALLTATRLKNSSAWCLPLTRGYLSSNVCNSPGMTIFSRPKRTETSRKKGAKRAQIGAKKCKRAQIQKTLPLKTHQDLASMSIICVCLTTPIPLAEKSVKPQLVRTCDEQIFQNEHFFPLRRL